MSDTALAGRGQANNEPAIAQDPNHLGHLIAADNDFHRALAKATQNPVVLSLVDSIVALLSEQRKLIFTVSNGPERGQLHHKILFETILRHDPVAAREAMLAHLRQVREDVASGLASTHPDAEENGLVLDATAEG